MFPRETFLENQICYEYFTSAFCRKNLFAWALGMLNLMSCRNDPDTTRSLLCLWLRQGNGAKVSLSTDAVKSSENFIPFQCCVESDSILAFKPFLRRNKM